MNRNRIYEIVRFGFAGGLSFVVDYALLFICTEWLGIYYLWSSAISFTVSVLVNYWLCLVYVFKGASRQSKRQKALFFGSSIAGLALNQLCMWLFVSIMGIYYMLAKILSTIVVSVWNYVMKRRAVKGK